MGTNTGHIKIVKCRVREYNYIYAYSKKVTPNATILEMQNLEQIIVLLY